MRRRSADVTEGNRIEFRIGINVNDGIIEGDDIHGDEVNVAARLVGLYGPGEVFVSCSVYDQGADSRLAPILFPVLNQKSLKIPLFVRRPSSSL